LETRDNLGFPAEVYFEGGDQFRGWFNSSLMCGLAAHDRSPYKQIVTYGWVVDGEGKQMHKSGGNAISPNTIVNKDGAETLRLWASAADITEDVRCSDEILQRVKDAYRKIRNTARFAVGNLDGFNPETDSVAFADLPELDRWALSELDEVIEKVVRGYENYNFQTVYQTIYNFVTVTLSARYFDIIKDRLYIAAPKSAARRAAQTVLYRIADNLARLVAPILAFTADEIWENLPQQTIGSVHLTEFPSASQTKDAELTARWERVFAVRDDVLKSLEEARTAKIIGSSLEAKIVLTADAENYKILRQYANDLRYVFIVSQVELIEGDKSSIEIKRADGEKCERCWNYSTQIGNSLNYPTVCERCLAALTEIEDSANVATQI
jgi:isoleucyl-tRNA synthetase